MFSLLQNVVFRFSIRYDRARIFVCLKTNTSFCLRLACVASVSVWFGSKEIPRKGILGNDRARNKTRAIFRAVFDSHSSFFSPKPHRNACYVGQSSLDICLILIYLQIRRTVLYKISLVLASFIKNIHLGQHAIVSINQPCNEVGTRSVHLIFALSFLALSSLRRSPSAN